MNIYNSSQNQTYKFRPSIRTDMLPSYFGQSPIASQFLDNCRANNKKPFSWLT